MDMLVMYMHVLISSVLELLCAAGEEGFHPTQLSDLSPTFCNLPALNTLWGLQ